MMAEAVTDQIKLVRQQKRLDHVYESVDYGIALLGPTGKIRYINAKGMKALGISDFMHGESVNILPCMRRDFQMKDVRNGTNDGGEYTYEIIPKNTPKVMVCVFRKIDEFGSGTEEYIMEIREKSMMHKSAMKLIGSNVPFSRDDIIGESDQMLQAKNAIDIASGYLPHTLILGESGTGKELFAQAIHNGSARANGPFVAINCGAIPKSLIESELFGYEPGSFTGARKQGYVGKFEQANGGTIFLDEIGDMPYETQVILLRVLQAREIVRVGGKDPIKIDVAVIAATNQDLIQKIQEKTFRKDLYYRLNAFMINIPPLRERGPKDISVLAEHFISKNPVAIEKKIKGITESALEKLRLHSWPGNVREFENVIERALLICREEQIDAADIYLESWAEPDDMPVNGSVNRKKEQAVEPMFRSGRRRRDSEDEQAKKEKISQVLTDCDYNLTYAAERLNISRPTLYKKLKEYGIDRYCAEE